MKKNRVIALVLSIIMIVGFAVSCSNETVKVEDQLAYVSFGDKGSRSFTTDISSAPGVENLYWTYDAEKVGGGLNTGAVSGEKFLGKGIAGKQVGPFSVGSWKFTLKGYAEETCTTLVYSGTSETVTLNAGTNNPINVEVVYQAKEGKGEIVVDRAHLDYSGSESITKMQIDLKNTANLQDTVQWTISNPSVSEEGKGQFSQEAKSLNAGVYEATFSFFVGSGESETLALTPFVQYVVVLNNRTTTISGCISEDQALDQTFTVTTKDEGFIESAGKYYVYVNTEGALQNAMNAAGGNENSVVVLTGDIETEYITINPTNSRSISIGLSNSITLDLNGFNLKKTSTSIAEDLIKMVAPNLTLTIMNSKNTGAIDAGNSTAAKVISGKIVIESGEVKGETALKVEAGAEAKITGGTLVGASIAIKNGGELQMNGGKISAETAIEITSDSSSTIVNSGTIDARTSVATSTDVERAEVIISAKVEKGDSTTSDNIEIVQGQGVKAGEELLAAVASGESNITLLNDITITDDLSVIADTVIDVNGKKFTAEQVVAAGHSLTIKDSKEKTGKFVASTFRIQEGGTGKLLNVNALMINYMFVSSKGTNEVYVENCVYAGYFSVNGNTLKSNGSKVTFKNSVINIDEKANWNSLYCAGYAEYVFEGNTINLNGDSPLYFKAGKVSIIDNIFNCECNENYGYDYIYFGNGAFSFASVIVIDEAPGYQGFEDGVEVKNNTFNLSGTNSEGYYYLAYNVIPTSTVTVNVLHDIIETGKYITKDSYTHKRDIKYTYDSDGSTKTANVVAYFVSAERAEAYTQEAFMNDNKEVKEILSYGDVVEFKNIVEVATDADFRNAIESNDVDVVKLADNFTLLSPVTITSGRVVTLDLNGKTIVYNGSAEIESSTNRNRPFQVYGDLSVKNGEVNSINEGQGGIQINNSYVYGVFDVRQNGKLKIYGGYFSDNGKNGGAIVRGRDNSYVLINNGSFVSTEYDAAVNDEGITIINDGYFYTKSRSGGKQLDNGKDSFSYCVISTKWTAGEYETRLEVNGGNVFGVQGGISVAAGTATINDVTSVADGVAGTISKDFSHYAIYVAGEAGEVSCVINGGNFTANKYALYVANTNTNGDGGINANACVTINGGTFNSIEYPSDVNVDSPLGSATINAGKFAHNTVKDKQSNSDVSIQDFVSNTSQVSTNVIDGYYIVSVK